MLVSLETVNRLKNNDNQAFEEIYQTYYRLIFCLSFSLLKDRYLAEDVTQDVFIKMMENITSLKRSSQFHAYLLAIAKNTTLNELKKRRDIPSDQIEQVTKQDDNHHFFIEEMHQYLTIEENEVIIYKIIYDFTFQEISHLFSFSLSSTYRLYRSALKKIKRHYEESL
ncbi:MAG: sigma-70 family RNA polymerase sigma factor [Bacilli bacterium]